MNLYTMGKIATEVYIVIMLAIIFAQWKKSDKELKAFGITSLFIALGNLMEILSSLLPGTASVSTQMLSIVCGNLSLPFMAYFFVCRINADAKRTVLKNTLPKTLTLLSVANIVLTIVLFVLVMMKTDEGSFSVLAIKHLLYSFEGLAGLVLCLTAAAKRRYLKQGTIIILISPILFSVMALITEFNCPQINIGYIGMSIGIFIQYITLLRRIGTEAEIKEQITLELLRTDSLTHLMNRQAFSDFLLQHTEDVDAGVMFFDVNELKRTNDELGHAEGDKLIVRCSELLNNTLQYAELYRISGDEFIAIYFGVDNQKYFEKELDEIQSVLKETGSLLSVGAFWGKQFKIVDTIKQAEKHMYDAKKTFYESSGKERRH